MEIKVINCDLFNNPSEAILLNIDGMGKTEGMEGRLARRFRELHPEMWQGILKFRPDEIALGDIFVYRPQEGSQYKGVIVASTHNHLEDLSSKEREDVIYTAFKKALQSCVKYHIKSIAAPVMVGGWRLNPVNAATAMSNALEKITGDPDLEVNICVLDEMEYLKVSGTFRTFGWID